MARKISFAEIVETRKPGSYIWAASIAAESRVPGSYVHAEPAYGMLTLARTEAKHRERMVRHDRTFPDYCSIYFIPCKNGSTSRLDWKRSVRYDSRFYADSEEAIWELYNAEIQRLIDWHREKIRSLTDMGSDELKARNRKD